MPDQFEGQLQSTPEPELSHPVNLTEVGRGDRNVSIIASEVECQKITTRLMIPAVNALKGDMVLKFSKSEIHVSGQIRADLTRECVASLEPVSEIIDDTFSISFLRTNEEISAFEALDSLDPDMPETLSGDSLDLGELLIQQLALMMSPFPRRTGVNDLLQQHGRQGEQSAFADLKAVLEKGQKNQ